MRWSRGLRLSVTALVASPGRTLMSASALAIGVAAAAVVFALGAGARESLRAALEQMGRDLLVVNAGRTSTDALRGASRQVETLKLADWRAIRELVPGVERSAPVVLRNAGLRAYGRSLEATLVGSTPELRRARNVTLLAGRYVDDHDVAESRRVAVLGANVVRELYSGEWPIGETVRIDGVPFTVVGALAAKGVTPDGASEDDQIVVPVSAAQRRLFDVDYIDRVFVQASSKAAIPGVEAGLRTLLRRRHGLDDATTVANVDDDFEILDQDALLAAQAETGQSFTRLVAGLAALTLALAGVGLLTVTLLAVRERTGEIGLRLAVGAQRRDVVLQFLAEALMVAAFGGLVGLAVGATGILLGGRLSGWPLVMTWRSVVVPFAIELAIAAVFAVYPALRAARLDPIVALRSS